MFSWLTERLQNFLQWWKGNRRRRSYRKKSAPVVSIPLQHEKIGKVRSARYYRSRESETRLLRTLMFAVIGVILAVAVIAIAVISSKVRSAEGVQWTWLNEFLGRETESGQMRELPSQTEEAEPGDSLLRIASVKSPLPEGWRPVLSSYEDFWLDERVIDDLKDLLKAMQEEDLALTVTGAYVSPEGQESIYQEKLQSFYRQGYSKARAEAAAAAYRNGCADAQTGLSVQISPPGEKTYAWLLKNAAEYGFVFRYPEGKEDQTGVGQDKTVLRYVGKDNAMQMRRLEMCLEEYSDYVAQR